MGHGVSKWQHKEKCRLLANIIVDQTKVAIRRVANKGVIN